jgi:hypothetical protein
VGPRDLLLVVADVLDRAGIRYFVSGSMASMAYGEYRSTLDVDVVIYLKLGQISALLDAFEQPDYYLAVEAIHDALEHCSQFNVIHVKSGLKVDFMTPDDTYHNQLRFERARQLEVAPGRAVWFSSPEDVILKKLEYFKMGGSDKHLRDIASMIKISGDTFDRAYLDQWAVKLGVMGEWAAARQRVGW